MTALDDQRRASEAVAADRNGEPTLSPTEVLDTILAGEAVAPSLVSQVLEHGLSILDALSMSAARRSRRRVDAVCERLEAVLDAVASVETADGALGIDLMRQLRSYPPAELMPFCGFSGSNNG